MFPIQLQWTATTFFAASLISTNASISNGAVKARSGTCCASFLIHLRQMSTTRLHKYDRDLQFTVATLSWRQVQGQGSLHCYIDKQCLVLRNQQNLSAALMVMTMSGPGFENSSCKNWDVLWQKLLHSSVWVSNFQAMYIHIHLYTYLCIHTCLWILYIYLFVYVYIYYVYVYILCICMCMYTKMYVYILYTTYLIY